jgi:hypothetical protein
LVPRHPIQDPDINLKVDAWINSLAGQPAEFAVDRDFLLLPENTDLFMLHYFTRDFTVWEPLNQALINFLEDNREGVAWLPGGHGKTTTLLRWEIKVICVEPQIAFIYVEKTEPTALSRSRAIMAQLTGNKQLIHDFGPFIGDPWSANAWTVATRPYQSDWPTMRVFGTGGAALGNRCNIMIVDDPVTTHNSSSEAERATIYQWYAEAAATCPAPLPLSNPKSSYLKKLFLVGTTFHLDDLYHQVLRQDPNLPHLHLRAVDLLTSTTLSQRFTYREPIALEEDAQTNPADAKLLEDINSGRVENLYNYRKTKGIIAFNRRYQNEVVDPSKQDFPEVWFRGGNDEYAPVDGYPGCLDRGRSLGDYFQGWRYVTGVDPASGSTSSKAARFVAATLGADPANPTEVHLVDLRFGQFPLELESPNRETQVGIILDHVKRYNSRVALETNNIQRQYASVIRAEAQRRGMVVSIHGHWTTKQGKADPGLGIEGLKPMIENGRLRLPYQLPQDQRVIEELINEFTGYPDVYPTTDIVMAVWFAWMVLQRQLKVGQGGRQVVSKPWYLHSVSHFSFPRDWSKEQMQAYVEGRAYVPDEEEDNEEVAV